MVFELYIPKNLEFCDYIEIVQLARTFADGYDRKVCQSSLLLLQDLILTNNRMPNAYALCWPRQLK